MFLNARYVQLVKTVPWEQRRSRNGNENSWWGGNRLCSEACCSLTGVNTTPLTTIYHPLPPLSLRLGGSADHDICERFFSHSPLSSHGHTADWSCKAAEISVEEHSRGWSRIKSVPKDQKNDQLQVLTNLKRTKNIEAISSLSVPPTNPSHLLWGEK